MKLDLDQLRTEIEQELKARGFVVFRGHSRPSSSAPFVYWDIEKYPDHLEFLETAAQAGARMVVFDYRIFEPSYVEDAMERLESAELPRDEQRSIERRLNALRDYAGFTCHLEISYDSQGRTYYFGLRTDWYEDLLDILDEIDATYPEDEEEEGEEPLGGYFSRN